MRRVYLLKEPSLPRDTQAAEVFGEIVTCLHQSEGSLSPGMVLNRLRSALRDYGEGDYILYAGAEWTVAFAAGIVLREMNVKKVDLLVWRKLVDGSRAYVPTRMVL